MKNLLLIISLLISFYSQAGKNDIYLIQKGNHSAKGNNFGLFVGKTYNAEVRFDNSAIYDLGNSNQADTNKLFGFSDCFSHHQTNSARIGWRWYEDELQIIAYAYSKKKRQIKKITSVPLNEIVKMSISVLGDKYIFKVGPIGGIELERGCSKKNAIGYKLYPYFGGDEVAPNDVYIFLKQSKNKN